jgi:hypothetical protein
MASSCWLKPSSRLPATRTGAVSKITNGPTKLLCYHACELFLKAYLRE